MTPELPLRHRTIAPFLGFLAFWSLAGAAHAATPEARLLADGLMDREAVCASYLHTQRAQMVNIAASWATDRRNEAAAALDAELTPIMADTCARAWRAARNRLADAIEARMPVADRAIVHRFLASSAGEKFVGGARASALRTLRGGGPMPPVRLSPDEQAVSEATFSSGAWVRYRAFMRESPALFDEAQVREGAIHRDEIVRRMRGVQARFAR